jgi:hypothetical protein
MSGYGYHWTPCHRGGGGLAAVVVGLVVVGAVIHAIWRPLVQAAEIAGLVVLGAAALAAVAGIVWVVLLVREHAAVRRTRQDRPGRPVTARVVIRQAPNAGPPLSPDHNQTAIEPPRARWPLAGQWAEIPVDTDRGTS